MKNHQWTRIKVDRWKRREDQKTGGVLSLRTLENVEPM